MNKIKHLKRFAVLLAVILIFGLGLCQYSKSLISNMQESAYDTLNELTQQQVFNINLKLKMDVSSIKSMAQILSDTGKEKLSSAKFLKELQRNTSFSYMAYADINGDGYNSSGQVLNVSDREFFKKALLGQTTVSMPVKSQLEDTTIIPISTPIFTDNEVSGILIGVYNTDKLRDMILPSYGGEGFAYVTDAQGKIIIEPKSKNSVFTNKYGFDNIFTGFELCEFLLNDNLETIKLNMQFGLAGKSLVKIDGLKRYSHYAPLGFNGWYLFMMVPEHAIMRQLQAIIQNSVMLAVAVIFIVICFLVLIMYLQQRTDKERKKYTEKLENIAFYDEVTGAPTVYRFKQLAVSQLQENPQTKAALIKFDIVNFKLINDIYGFDTGNKILKAVKEAVDEIAKKANSTNIFCTRINADEFVVFDGQGGAESGTDRWNVFLREFHEKTDLLVKHWRFEFCAGRYFTSYGEDDLGTAMEKVNLAHRTAKKEGISGFCDYDISLRKIYIEKIEIENKMHDALKNNEFKLYLQPKYCLSNEKLAGAEALVRWQLQDGEIISPGKFISIFESNGFITKLDFYMFEQVCALISNWRQQGKKPVPISVNFSRLHLTNPDFVTQLVDIANKYEIERRLLEIELTESVFFDNAEIIENLLHDLRKEGFSLSIDDFGTGYSSLGLLKDLPIDIIKIDQSFFTNNKYAQRARAVIESVMQMAKKLGIFTVAEGVETKEHVNLLRSVGCDLVQGYYFARPEKAEQFVLD